MEYYEEAELSSKQKSKFKKNKKIYFKDQKNEHME